MLSTPLDLRKLCIPCISTALVFLLISSVFGSESEWEVARTEHGYPDLQGAWSNWNATPIQRPRELDSQRAYTEEVALALESNLREGSEQNYLPSDPNRAARPIGDISLFLAEALYSDSRTNLVFINGEYRTSLIVSPSNGRFPFTENGRSKDIYGQWRAQGLNPGDGPEFTMIGERCITGNGTMPPMAVIAYNSNIQIVQTSDYVVIIGEMVNDARIIRLNSVHQAPHMKKWLGDSIAYYEEDTLVVHTQNFRPEQSNMRIVSSEELQVTERFTPVSDDKIFYTFTVEDPVIYTEPVVFEFPLNRLKDGDWLFEFACHEGNYSMPGILAGARRLEIEGK